jgi:hypothetical protein
MLNFVTTYGKYYKVTPEGNIIRCDQKGFVPSGKWKFIGLSHVKRACLVPLAGITPENVKTFTTWKNGKPQWAVWDLDHGTMRQWGDGVNRLWFD